MAPRIYTRVAFWRKLGPKERLVHIVRALAEIHPDWIFTGTTAAVLHGLYVSYDDIEEGGKPQIHVQGRSGKDASRNLV